MSKAVVYDSTRKTRDNRPRGFTTSLKNHRRPGRGPVVAGEGAQQAVHSTLKILTVASVVHSCLFLNLLAFLCALPAFYYSFHVPHSKSKAREGRMLDRAKRALIWNFLSLLTYIPYSVAIFCAIYFTITAT